MVTHKMHALLLVLLPAIVLGCGFTTHTTVAHRAHNHFFHSSYGGYEQLFNTYPGSLYGGAPFPDYMFECGHDHDAGEADHWPPWQAAAAKYVRAKPRPWDEGTQKLVTFLFGCISHYIADLNWHGQTQMPSGYGFIESLGICNFNCTGNLCWPAHDAADTGGEFVAAYETDLAWFAPDQWDVPADDLSNIFLMINHTVSADDVNTCHLLFSTGGMAIKYFGELLFMNKTAAAPFMVEHYINFPSAGIDDMAIWTGRMWQRYEKWIEEGPPTPLPPMANSAEPRAIAYRQRKAAKRDLLRALSVLVDSQAASDWLHGLGDETAVRESIHTRLLAAAASNDVHMRHALDQLRQYTSPALVQQLLDTARTTTPAAVGHVMKTHHATRSVHRSAPSAATPAAAGSPAALTAVAPHVVDQLVSAYELEYMGSALTSGDYNQDGIADLVVGAYGHTETTAQPQAGRVYIRFGTSSSPSPSPPPFIIDSNLTYARFGWSLATLDFNLDGVQDLVVGAPLTGWNWDDIPLQPEYHYRGAVFVYFGQAGVAGFSATPDYTISTQKDVEHFGYSLSTGDINGDGHADLLVGSPLSRGLQGSGDQQGSLRGYLSYNGRTAGGTIDADTCELALDPQAPFAWFGHSATVMYRGKEPLLLVGAPMYRSDAGTVGRLYAYSMQDWQPHAMPSIAFTLTGEQEKAQAAYSFAVGAPIPTSPTLLALSSPTFSASLAAMSGQVLLIDVTSLKGDLQLKDLSPLTTLLSGSYGARLGATLQFTDLNGDHIDDLVVGAPLLSPSLEEHHHTLGAMLAWKGGATFPTGTVYNSELSPDWRSTGSLNWARFGAAVVPLSSSTANTTTTTLAVSSPFSYNAVDGTIKQMGGQVTVFGPPFF